MISMQMDLKSQKKVQVISESVHVHKVVFFVFAIYVLLTVSFYFIAGEQLRIRASRGNMEMPVSNAITSELTQGIIVEQLFTTNIQRLETVKIGWETFARANNGNVSVELINTRDGSRLMSQNLSAADMGTGFISTMSSEKPIEGLYKVPLLLRITADSAAGSAVSPLRNKEVSKNGFELSINKVAEDGVLCFAASGTDYIWTGLYYWVFVSIGAVLLIAYLLMALYKHNKGKKVMLFHVIVAIKKYRFLIQQLVSRDFKTKYKRSVLGIFWSFLNPLLTMFVQYLVFSNLFRFDIPYYPVYLLCGIVSFNFFTESCGMSLMSIVGNTALITKVYVPKYIYPLTRLLSSIVNLVMSLIPLFIVTVISGILPKPSYLFVAFGLLCLAIFCLGFGLLLASSMVFFRDTQFLWGVFSMIWMYLTPIFYPESILPKGIDIVLKINPMHYFIKFIRICIIDGVSPEPIMYVYCLLFALVSLLVGALVFKKTQDKFVLYI